MNCSVSHSEMYELLKVALQLGMPLVGIFGGFFLGFRLGRQRS